MNDIFSLKRVGLILRADWIENKKTWMITMGLLLLAYVLLLWNRAVVQNSMIGWTILIAAILFFNFVEKKIHHSKGLFLTLPASNLEKFVAIWLVAFFYLISCFLIFWSGIGVNSLVNGYPVVEFFRTIPNTGVVALTVFFTCWLFASYVTFPKNAFVIGVVLLIVLVFGLIYIFAEVATIESLNTYDWGHGLGGFVYHYHIVLYFLSAALLYYSFRVLAKKQIR